MFLVDKLVKPLSNRINLDALTGTFSEAIRGLSVNVAQKDKVVTALNHSTSNMKGADATLSDSGDDVATFNVVSNTSSFVKGSSNKIKVKSGTKLKTFSGVTGVAYAPVQLVAGTYDWEMEMTITHRGDHTDYKSFFGGWNVGGTNGAVTIHAGPNKVYVIAKATDGTVVATSSNGSLTNNTNTFLSLIGHPTTYKVKREGNTLKGFRNGVEQFSRDCTGKSFGNTFINHFPIGYNGTSGTPNSSVFGNTVGNITYHRVRYTENTTRDFEYDFSEASGNTLNDLSGNGNHGTVTSGSQGLDSRWADAYSVYPSVLHNYSFIPSSITITGANDSVANDTYYFSGYGELVSGLGMTWLSPNAIIVNNNVVRSDYYIAFDDGGPYWAIYDGEGNEVSDNTAAGTTLLPPEGTWSNNAVVTYSNHGIFISKTGNNITKLVQYDEDETTLTSEEKADNERYFG